MRLFFFFFPQELCVNSVQACGNTSLVWDHGGTPLLYKKGAASICDALWSTHSHSKGAKHLSGLSEQRCVRFG